MSKGDCPYDDRLNTYDGILSAHATRIDGDGSFAMATDGDLKDAEHTFLAEYSRQAERFIELMMIDRTVQSGEGPDDAIKSIEYGLWLQRHGNWIPIVGRFMDKLAGTLLNDGIDQYDTPVINITMHDGFKAIEFDGATVWETDNSLGWKTFEGIVIGMDHDADRSRFTIVDE